MATIFHKPSAPLDAYIQCLWYSEGPAPFPRLKVLPMPSMRLQVNLGDAIELRDAERAQSVTTCSESWMVGLYNNFYFMEWPQTLEIINVTFKPGGMYPFLQLPLSQLHNEIVPLEAILGSLANEIRDRLQAAPTIEARFSLLERILLARLREIPDGLNTVQHAVAEIDRHNGALSIQALSDELNISQKHLITLFKRMVGATPKELARIYRFAHILYSIDPTKPVNWGYLAHQSGYCDQSHFNKDFEAYTGNSPTDYLLLRRHIHLQHPGRTQYPQYLPTG